MSSPLDQIFVPELELAHAAAHENRLHNFSVSLEPNPLWNQLVVDLCGFQA